MNKLQLIIKNYFVLVMLFYSCGQVNISKPQPIDSDNINSFPKNLRGIWIDESDSLIIGRNYYELRINRHEKIALNELDTLDKYLLSQNKIYVIEPEEYTVLRGGFPYEIKHDTIFFNDRLIIYESLGSKACLRVLKNAYLLNLKLDFTWENQWWTLLLLEIDVNKNLIVRYICEHDLKNMTNYIEIYKEGGGIFGGGINYYIDANWTQKDIEEMIKNGAFTDTLFVRTYAGKLK